MHKLVRVYGMNNVFQYMLDHIPEGSNYTIQNKKAFSRMAGAQYIMTEADYHVMEERYNKVVAQNAAFDNPSGEKFALHNDLRVQAMYIGNKKRKPFHADG